jgi:protein-S-isoprenylcysteine O-methyltransferase Ste14
VGRVIQGSAVAAYSGLIVGVSWLVFLAVWAVLATVYGGSAPRTFSPRARAVRLLLFVGFLLAMIYGWNLRLFGAWSANVANAGSALCVLGLAFAIWARVSLASNWGMPMTLHANPELVTSGPYRFVRHPIYTGLTAMLFGTALVFPIAALPGGLMIAYSLHSARREERDMERRFPDAYPAYRQRSKFLVPFLF